MVNRFFAQGAGSVLNLVQAFPPEVVSTTAVEMQVYEEAKAQGAFYVQHGERRSNEDHIAGCQLGGISFHDVCFSSKLAKKMRLGDTSTVDSNFVPSTLIFVVLVQLSTFLALKPVICFFGFQPRALLRKLRPYIVP